MHGFLDTFYQNNPIRGSFYADGIRPDADTITIYILTTSILSLFCRENPSEYFQKIQMIMGICRQGKTGSPNHENPDPERANSQLFGSQGRSIRSLLVAQKMHNVFSDSATSGVCTGIRIHIVLFGCVKSHNIILPRLRNPSIGQTDPL